MSDSVGAGGAGSVGEGEDPVEQTRAAALTKAVDLLALRPHFRAELAAKLAKRGFDAQAVDAALARLEELAYLDDLAAARGFAAQKVERQGWGPRRLTAELSRRGVDEGHVRTVVDEAYPEGEAVIARDVAARWAARGRGDRDRLARYLDRRGFSKSVIVEILRQFDAERARDA